MIDYNYLFWLLLCILLPPGPFIIFIASVIDIVCFYALLEFLFYIPWVMGPVNVIIFIASAGYFEWYGKLLIKEGYSVFPEGYCVFPIIRGWEQQRYVRVETIRRAKNKDLFACLALFCVGYALYMFMAALAYNISHP
jgi:hypothetical protein